MAVCYTPSTCPCCPCLGGAVLNSCCPGECWTKVFLTLTDKVNGCTKTYQLNWNGNDTINCGDNPPNKGVWEAFNQPVGNCLFTFKVACIPNVGVCTMILEAIETAGPGAGTSVCRAEIVGLRTCNPLHSQGTTGTAFPIGAVCGCADQPGGSTFTITE